MDPIAARPDLLKARSRQSEDFTRFHGSELPHGYNLPSLSEFRKEAAVEIPAPLARFDVCVRFGAVVRSLRLNCGLTQTEMARKFGIDRSFISDVERGAKSISLSYLETYAAGFKISLSELLRDL